MPLIGLGAGTALGIGKHFLIDKPAADRKRKVAAEQTRWSPWTGMGVGDPGESPNLMGSLMQGGLSGASLGQGIDSSNAYNDMLQKQASGDTLGGINKSSWMDLDSEINRVGQMQNQRRMGPRLMSGY